MLNVMTSEPPTMVRCPQCSGDARGEADEDCPLCGGLGKVTPATAAVWRAENDATEPGEGKE